LSRTNFAPSDILRLRRSAKLVRDLFFILAPFLNYYTIKHIKLQGVDKKDGVGGLLGDWEKVYNLRSNVFNQ